MTGHCWPDDILELFAPFIRDAANTLGVQLVAQIEDIDDSSVLVMLTASDDEGDGFRFDRQGTPEDRRLQALESFDVLQESVHEFLVRHRNDFGPWPRCPVDGHSHKLTVAPHPETDRPWWTCPEGTAVTPLGELSAR